MIDTAIRLAVGKVEQLATLLGATFQLDNILVGAGNLLPKFRLFEGGSRPVGQGGMGDSNH